MATLHQADRNDWFLTFGRSLAPPSLVPHPDPDARGASEAARPLLALSATWTSTGQQRKSRGELDKAEPLNSTRESLPVTSAKQAAEKPLEPPLSNRMSALHKKVFEIRECVQMLSQKQGPRCSARSKGHFWKPTSFTKATKCRKRRARALALWKTCRHAQKVPDPSSLGLSGGSQAAHLLRNDSPWGGP
jgi:hypothetical protein